MIRLSMLILSILVLSGCTSITVQKSMSAADCPPERVLSDATQTEKDIMKMSPESVVEPNGLLTLRDALSLTLLHNPELDVYSYATRAAQARQLQAGLWQNPELEMEVENFGGSGKFNRFDSAATTIQLSQLIELGGKINKRKQAFGYSTKLEQARYDAKRMDVSTDLTKSFIELLFIQEKETLSQEFMDLSQEVVDSVGKRVQAGKDSPIDLSKAKVRLSKVKLVQLEATKYKEALRKKLATYWDSQNPTFTLAAGQLDEIDDLPLLDDVQKFLTNNPDLIQRAIEVQKRTAEMSLAQAKSTPDIKIAGGVKYFNENDDTAFVMGLSIPLQISDRNQGGRMEATQNLRMAQQQHKVTELTVWNEVNRLYADLETAFKKAVILRDEVLTLSQEVFNASKISYEQGKKDYLELLDAQRIYFTAKNDYVDALAEYHLNKTELERLIGQNLQQININN